MNTAYRTVSAAAVAMLAAATLGAPASSTMPSASSPAVPATRQQVTSSALTPADPMAGEYAVWTGQATAKRAPVTLEVAKGSKWKTLTSLRTDRTGHFAATVRAGEVGVAVRYRIAADGKTLARRKVTAIAQTATLAAPVAIGGNQSKMTATFSPIRKGRRVALLIALDGGWAMNQGDTQNSRGQVTYTITLPPPGGSMLFLAEAFSRNGAVGVSSNTQSVTS